MPKPEAAQAAYMFSPDMKFMQKAVVLHPTEDKILALRRSTNSHNRPGKWDLAGGSVSFGEPHDTALRREIREETTLEVSELKPAQVLTKFDKDSQIYYLLIGYVTRALSVNVTLSGEHTDFRWVTRNEFTQLDSADFLQDLVSRSQEIQL